MSETITPKAVTFQQIKLYFPCEVYRKDMNKCIHITGFTDLEEEGSLTDDAGNAHSEILLVSGFAARWSMKDFIKNRCRLILRELSSITEAEAIEISRLAISHKQTDFKVIEIRKSSFIVTHESGKYQVFPQKAFTITLQRFDGLRKITDMEDITTIHNPHLVFQYLLSKKFDIGILPKEAYMIMDEKNGGLNEPE